MTHPKTGLNSKDYRSTRLYNDELGWVQSFWNLSIWNWGWISAKKLYTCGLTYYCTFMYVSVHSITSVLLNSFSCISYNDIQCWLYSDLTWVRLFQYVKYFLVRKSFIGSFWDSYPSKNCQRLICQGHFDAFDVSFKILNHPEMSSNGLERFWKGQKTPWNKNNAETSKSYTEFPQY